MGQFFSPRNFMRIVWRRLPIILLILMIGLPSAVWFAVSQPKVYEATAIIQIEAPQVVGTLPASGLVSGNPNNELDIIQGSLTSRDSLLRLIERYELFPAAPTLLQRVALMRESVEIVKLIDPAQAFRPDAQPLGLSITVRLDDPDTAAAVANELLSLILTEAQERSAESVRESLAFFTEQEMRVNAQIETIEAEISQFKEINAGSLPTEQGDQRLRMNTLEEQLLVVDGQILALETNSDRVREEEIIRQRALLDTQRNLLVQTIAEVQAAMARSPEVERELSALERELDQLETELGTIITQRTEATIREQLENQEEAARYKVLEEAVAPDFAVSTSRRNIALAGAMAAGMAALGAALLIEMMNPVIRNSSQLEAQLGVKPVVTVPHLKNRVQRRRSGALVVTLLLGVVGAVGWFFFGLKDAILGLFRKGVGSH